MVRTGTLVPVLPGVYASPEVADTVDARICAAMAWDRDAVLTGATAARVSFWPTAPMREVSLATALGDDRTKRAGFHLERRRIPPQLVQERSGLRFTAPALTALDLSVTDGGDGIDTVLRSRAATWSGVGSCWTRAMSRGRRRSGRPSGCCAAPAFGAG